MKDISPAGFLPDGTVHLCRPVAAGLHITHGSERGAHGGKSEVSPRAPCALRFRKKHSTFPVAGVAHCAKPILWTKPERTATDTYGRLRTMGLWRSVGHVPGSLESTWLTGGGWRSALCRADTAGREIGLIGPIGLIRREHLERCMPCAVKIPEHMAVREP